MTIRCKKIKESHASCVHRLFAPPYSIALKLSHYHLLYVGCWCSKGDFDCIIEREFIDDLKGVGKCCLSYSSSSRNPLISAHFTSCTYDFVRPCKISHRLDRWKVVFEAPTFEVFIVCVSKFIFSWGFSEPTLWSCELQGGSSKVLRCVL